MYKHNYLHKRRRHVTDGLLKTLGVTLAPLSPTIIIWHLLKIGHASDVYVYGYMSDI